MDDQTEPPGSDRVESPGAGDSNQSDARRPKPATDADDRGVAKRPWIASVSKGSRWVIGAVVVGFLGAAGAATWAVVQNALPQPAPLAAVLDFGNDDCVQVVMDRAATAELPSREDFDMRWAYEHGAAEHSKGQYIDLTVQGTTSDVVVLHSLEVVDLAIAPLPADPVTVTKCAPAGGALEGRYFDLDLLGSPPVFTAEVGEDPEPDAAPIEFPYTVSSTEPERFLITQLVESAECVCTWRLAIEWSSGARQGVLIVDRGYSAIRTAVAPSAAMKVWNEDGTWSDY